MHSYQVVGTMLLALTVGLTLLLGVVRQVLVGPSLWTTVIALMLGTALTVGIVALNMNLPDGGELLPGYVLLSLGALVLFVMFRRVPVLVIPAQAVAAACGAAWSTFLYFLYFGK